MASLTNKVKIHNIACETKNNGSPTMITASVDITLAGQVTWLLLLGAVAAGAKVNLHIEEADDNAAFVDIADKALAEIPDTGDNGVYAIEVPITTASKRYQRAVCTVADGAPGAALAIACILSDLGLNTAKVARQDLTQLID
jgi:hypothetical protein